MHSRISRDDFVLNIQGFVFGGLGNDRRDTASYVLDFQTDAVQFGKKTGIRAMGNITLEFQILQISGVIPEFVFQIPQVFHFQTNERI